MMRAIVFEGAGGNEVVRVIKRPVPVPGPMEVLVRVTRAGVNPADLAQRAGRYPAPVGVPADVAGLEVAGLVIGRGPGVERWSEGDRVFGLVAGGGLADHVVAHERCLAQVPDTLDDDESAAAPEAYITAHDALITVGLMRPGDRVLVTGANGGVGAAAVQLALAYGGAAVGTSRSETGLDLISSLGAQALHHEELVGLAGLADDPGFDVVIELVGGTTLSHLPALLAPRGRAVVVGVSAGDGMDAGLRTLIRKRARIEGTNLRNRPLEDKALAVQAFAREVVPLLASGRVVAHVEATYPHTEAAVAFDRLETSGKRGKVLLAFDA